MIFVWTIDYSIWDLCSNSQCLRRFPSYRRFAAGWAVRLWRIRPYLMSFMPIITSNAFGHFVVFDCNLWLLFSNFVDCNFWTMIRRLWLSSSVIHKNYVSRFLVVYRQGSSCAMFVPLSHTRRKSSLVLDQLITRLFVPISKCQSLNAARMGL